MNEKPRQTGTSEKPKSQEGRSYDAQGNDKGDVAFHREGFDLDRQERTILDDLAEDIIHEEETLAGIDPSKAADIYKRLRSRYPNHPRAALWAEKEKTGS